MLGQEGLDGRESANRSSSSSLVSPFTTPIATPLLGLATRMLSFASASSEQEVDYTSRAVTMANIMELYNVHAKRYLKDLSDDLQVTCTILGRPEEVPTNSALGASSHRVNSPSRGRGGTAMTRLVVKTESHHFYVKDRLHVLAETTNQHQCCGRITIEANSHQKTMEVVEVRSPSEFVIECDIVQMQNLQLHDGQKLAAPLNMHKLVPEVLIPLTTIQETIVHLTHPDDVTKLMANLDGAHQLTLSSGFFLEHAKHKLEKGLTLHGRLSANGHVRRGYWSSRQSRSEGWYRQGVADPIPDGWDAGEEERYASKDDIVRSIQCDGEVRLVFRKGVSYAERCGPISITEFISHNWGEPAGDFCQSLHKAQVRAAWICAFALDQHCVPSLSKISEELPFYQALLSLRNNPNTCKVVMVLDRNATALKRIWCVFECWVCFQCRLRLQLFSPEGEINFWLNKGDVAAARREIQNLDLVKAESSVEADRVMILAHIGKHGGMPNVTWQVKCKLSMGALVFFRCLISTSSSYLFSFPLFYGLVHVMQPWFVSDDSPTWQFLAFLFPILGALFPLWYWKQLLLSGSVIGTVKGILISMKMRKAFAWSIFIISMMEIATVSAILVLWRVRNLGRRDATAVVLRTLCEGKHEDYWLASTILYSLYVFQTLVPWMSLRCMQLRYFDLPVTFQDFKLAEPRLGMRMTLVVLAIIYWYEDLSRDSLPDLKLCEYTGAKTLHELASIPWEGSEMWHMLLISLIIWAFSVALSIVSSASQQVPYQYQNCVRLGAALIVLVPSTCWFWRLEQNFHAIVALCVIIVADMFWYRRNVCQFVRLLLRRCEGFLRRHNIGAPMQAPSAPVNNETSMPLVL